MYASVLATYFCNFSIRSSDWPFVVKFDFFNDSELVTLYLALVLLGPLINGLA